MGRIGSCVPRQVMSAALAPHCWNATSLADPEYVMDFRSPSAFCALAITVLASCAMAIPHRNTRQVTPAANLLNTDSPLYNGWPMGHTRPEYSISSLAAVAPKSHSIYFVCGTAGQMFGDIATTS